METVAWVGLSASLFAALLIGTKRRSSVPDRILAGWLSLLAFEFLTSALDYKVFGHPLLSNSFLLFNPAFYLYVRSLTNRHFRLRWIQLLHLIPYLSFEVSAYILNEPQSLESFIDNSPKLAFRIIFGVVSILSWFLYNIRSYLLVHKHRKGLEDEFSSLETYISLGWILFVVIFYSVFCIISFSMGVYVISSRKLMLMPNIYVQGTLLLLVYILAYYGLMQKEIYSRIIPEEIPEKHKKSVLSASVKKNLKKNILEYFETEEPFLNPELNMDMLSSHLKIPKHRITEVLNTEIGKNFFQFVNSYRIEAVKEKLADMSNPYSIEAIGYECGFNSKSSFFTVFKKFTGQTPHQYKQSAHLKQPSSQS